MKRLIGCLLAPLLFLVFVASPKAQERDPTPILGSVIFQFQNGRPIPGWYNPQLWQLFTMQTNGTYVYPHLQMIGPVQRIQINEVLRLPVGSLYSMTAFHASGRSDWRIGINKYSDQIEYADLSVNQGPYQLPRIGPVPNPTPNPNPYPNPDPNPDPNPNPNPDPSPACQQFPDLC